MAAMNAGDRFDDLDARLERLLLADNSASVQSRKSDFWHQTTARRHYRAVIDDKSVDAIFNPTDGSLYSIGASVCLYQN